ncbi:MAG: SPO1 DNA polymerase [Gammaproteobacteria bacterium HGW-Gammaproteobacteria-3]|nr:MAG: SPO1 DNA polymerase [Gammaproteobacteria bacterium HGW-Gammaproteobacteria-3]
MNTTNKFDPNCRKCQRLDDFLVQVKRNHPGYHARPVAPFGDDHPDLLVVGLAPGLHGANATGRPFTGDYAGILLYKMLHRFGFSNRPDAKAPDDGLVLKNCRITNAVKCLPPQNKPTGAEINTCNAFLAAELEHLAQGSIILALGSIAHQAILKASGLKLNAAAFGHNRLHVLPTGHYLLDSYHTSRYNIQTRRLTEAMFEAVFHNIVTLLEKKRRLMVQ